MSSQRLVLRLQIAAWPQSQSLWQVLPLAGKLSDDWGRKRLFLGSVALFTLSSMAAGAAPNVGILIVCRVLQAIGGGAFLPSATGIVSDAFGEKRGPFPAALRERRSRAPAGRRSRARRNRGS